jgi:hypothetical protein
MLKSDGYALFIGINDYSAYDPSGASNLPGSINDAVAFWRMGRQLGLAPARMRILTSGRVDLARLGGATEANVGEANEQGILSGVRWLAAKLAEEARPTGLFTYSGHGAYTDAKGLSICPSDTRGPELERAISMNTLQLELAAVSENLTVVLDCCHAGAPDPRAVRGLVPSLSTGKPPGSVREEDRRIAARVLAACGVHETTQQARFLGLWHGAFTWALGSALDQWKEVPDAEGGRIDVTYGELMDRTKKLLAALSFKGTPALLGPTGVEKLSVDQAGNLALPTSEAANAKRPGVQVDPGQRYFRWYTFSWEGGLTANVLVTNEGCSINNVPYSSGIEYWFINDPEKLSKTGASLTVTWEDFDRSAEYPTIPTTSSFTTNRVPSWEWLDSGAEGIDDVYLNTDTNVALYWAITSGQGSSYSGGINWYSSSAENNIFAGDCKTPVKFNLTNGLTENVSWQWAQTSAQTPSRG